MLLTFLSLFHMQIKGKSSDPSFETVLLVCVKWRLIKLNLSSKIDSLAFSFSSGLSKLGATGFMFHHPIGHSIDTYSLYVMLCLCISSYYSICVLYYYYFSRLWEARIQYLNVFWPCRTKSFISICVKCMKFALWWRNALQKSSYWFFFFSISRWNYIKLSFFLSVSSNCSIGCFWCYSVTPASGSKSCFISCSHPRRKWP